MYVDGVVSVGEYADGTINIMETFFRLKERSLGRPDKFLGANFEKIQITYGRVIWPMNCQYYMKNYIYKVKNLAEEYGKPLHKKENLKIQR